MIDQSVLDNRSYLIDEKKESIVLGQKNNENQNRSQDYFNLIISDFRKNYKERKHKKMVKKYIDSNIKYAKELEIKDLDYEVVENLNIKMPRLKRVIFENEKDKMKKNLKSEK